ncbi:hypothetical protein PS662_02882 [Pseudomonas fluorescens]|uniref:DUF4123 domain-containing protein n=1 Tax=Pseudomonas fluorescens TaxID=294 RepID=A0A5E6TFM1_PSEFL|nr:DUF4123 domain-containing protein [Pseudomonas fluorescens]VVM40203.1 hypothetical protein PS662_00245 [Pseudomonas fluorescens]VVM92054.1 hypothetical protein PS662_02882 [Pseudomonas fluorescens]
MINTLPRQWMNEQRRLGHELCLVLDSQNERDTRQLLMKSSGHDQYLSVYNGTTLVNMADAGPYMFTLEQSGDRRLDDLLDHPDRNWGWLASVEKGALREWVQHWQERLIVGTRPYQALYRFHDNRVLSRALNQLPVEESPAFLGPAISVCYWDGTAWKTAQNPAPGTYPVPDSPLWLRTPLPQPQASEIRRLNAHRYLLAEHVEAYANLAEVHDPDAWLRTQHAACSLAIQQKNGLPDRPPLLAQIFQAGNHSMTGGYVPACWAVLLRWKTAQESKKSRVTDIEFDSVARSLARITQQLRDEEDNLPGRSDAYGRTRENLINALRLERSKIETTVNRLKKIRPERISAHALYGSLSEQPEQLEANLARWLAHPENKVKDPFAMAPEDPDEDALTASIYGHTVGAPYTLDIDSIC